MKSKAFSLIALLLAAIVTLAGCGILPLPEGTTGTTAATTTATTTAAPTVGNLPYDIPDYNGSPYYIMNNNQPSFTEEELTAALTSYEEFSPLDALERCGVVEASVGVDLMPTEDRGSIGMVKPSGWQTAKYDIVSGKYLYNRCHLIGFQLTGENANELNLITGTRYLNIDGMLPFENMIAAYVKDTENHVLFRVTPVFIGNELVARGLIMEAYSVEDDGDGICFCVFAYNVQPGIVIHYADGTSYLSSDPPPVTTAPATTAVPSVPTEPSGEEVKTYVVNTSTDKFHDPDCRYANSMKEENRDEITATRTDLIEAGYDPCGTCKP